MSCLAGDCAGGGCLRCRSPPFPLDPPHEQVQEARACRHRQGPRPRGRSPPDDPRPRRARAQPEERRSRDPARRADRVHGAVGLGQVVARVRHDLCRGAAALRGEPVGLRAPVPGDDAEARRRPHRRAVAGHLHRAEDHLQEPALHRRHGHRDLRLPAPAVRARRRALLAGHRAADREPDRAADGRPGAGAAGGHAALPAGARSCAAARASTARSWRSCRRRASSASRSTAQFYEIAEAPKLDKKYKHDIDVVVDRLVVRADIAHAAGRQLRDGAGAGRRHRHRRVCRQAAEGRCQTLRV